MTDTPMFNQSKDEFCNQIKTSIAIEKENGTGVLKKLREEFNNCKDDKNALQQLIKTVKIKIETLRERVKKWEKHLDEGAYYYNKSRIGEHLCPLVTQSLSDFTSNVLGDKGFGKLLREIEDKVSKIELEENLRNLNNKS